MRSDTVKMPMPRSLPTVWRLLIAAFVVCLLGCSNEPTLPGYWISSFEENTMAVQLQPDGHFTGTATVGRGTDVMQFNVSGTYTLNDPDLTVKIDTASPADAATNPFMLPVLSRLQGYTLSGRIEWKNKNEFLLTTQHALVEFDRKADSL